MKIKAGGGFPPGTSTNHSHCTESCILSSEYGHLALDQGPSWMSTSGYYGSFFSVVRFNSCTFTIGRGLSRKGIHLLVL